MIQIKDETAGVLLLTIDDTGQMCFGNGTPINMLTLDSYGVVDRDGVIQFGLASSSVGPSFGSVFLFAGTSVNVIAAGSVKNPMCMTESAQFPAYYYYYDNGTTSFLTSPLTNTPDSQVIPGTWEFTVLNCNESDNYYEYGYGDNQASAARTINYQWI